MCSSLSTSMLQYVNQNMEKNMYHYVYTLIFQNGMKIEVHNKSKQDYAVKLGVTPRQLGHRFHYTNEHKEAKGLPLKGYTFGNL